MTRAVLSVGSNLGDRLAHLQSALDGLGPLVRAVSPVYETAPWGPVDQGDYLNAIVVVDDGIDTSDAAGSAIIGRAPHDATPTAGVTGDEMAEDRAGAGAGADADVDAAAAGVWLRRAHRLELSAGRVRTVRYGPRTLDVDVITVDDVRSVDPGLTLPHPRAHERAFVLVPLLAVWPDAVLPGHGTVADLVVGLPSAATAGVRRRADLTLTWPGPSTASGRAAVMGTDRAGSSARPAPRPSTRPLPPASGEVTGDGSAR